MLPKKKKRGFNGTFKSTVLSEVNKPEHQQHIALNDHKLFDTYEAPGVAQHYLLQVPKLYA